MIVFIVKSSVFKCPVFSWSSSPKTKDIHVTMQQIITSEILEPDNLYVNELKILNNV